MDYARKLIPPGATIHADPGWATGTWSSRKTYTFETLLSRAEYRSWAQRELGSEWHCHAGAGPSILCTRLLTGEQQVLDMELESPDPKRLRVRVTFTAVAT